MPLLSDTGGPVDGGGGEDGFRGEERRRRRRAGTDHDGGDDVHGKMKVGNCYIYKYILSLSTDIFNDYLISISFSTKTKLPFLVCSKTRRHSAQQSPWHGSIFFHFIFTELISLIAYVCLCQSS